MSDVSCWRSTPVKVKNMLPPEPPARLVKRRLRGSWEPPSLYFIPPRCQVNDREERRVKLPQSLNIDVFNVRGCSTSEVKKGEIRKMFLRRRLGVCAISETMLKGKGKVVGWQGVWRGGRRRKGALLLSEMLLRCVMESKEVSSKLMWIRVKVARVSGVYIGIWTR